MNEFINPYVQDNTNILGEECYSRSMYRCPSCLGQYRIYYTKKWPVHFVNTIGNKKIWSCPKGCVWEGNLDGQPHPIRLITADSDQLLHANYTDTGVVNRNTINTVNAISAVNIEDDVSNPNIEYFGGRMNKNNNRNGNYNNQSYPYESSNGRDVFFKIQPNKEFFEDDILNPHNEIALWQLHNSRMCVDPAVAYGYDSNYDNKCRRNGKLTETADAIRTNRINNTSDIKHVGGNSKNCYKRVFPSIKYMDNYFDNNYYTYMKAKNECREYKLKHPLDIWDD